MTIPAFHFTIAANAGAARAGTFVTPHGPVQTPAFMAVGTLATVNGVGDFASSVTVGLLWTFLGPGAAFGDSAVLFLCGAWMVWRLPAGGRSPP